MLKYSFNLDSLKSDLKKVEVSSMVFSDLHDDDEKYSILCSCHYDVDNNLSTGDSIVFVGKQTIDLKPFPIEYDINIMGEVFSVNELKSLFTVMIDKYDEMKPKSVRYATLEGKDWLYMSFDKPHLFNAYKTNEITVFIRIEGTHCFNEEGDYDTDRIFSLEKCEWVTQNVVRYDVSNLKEWKYLYDILLADDSSEVNMSKMTIFRENILFDENIVYTIYQNKPLTTICVGLDSNPDVNLLQNENLSEYFVEEEIRKSINPIVEMEKCIFHPVIIKDNANLNKIDGEYTDVYEIEFNLHFRPHKGEDWTVDDKDYWNGVEVKDGKPEFIDEYFSYEDKSRQSDLLGYLDFNNGDIKFQKNRLKKSFLRLSFYDSDKPYKQNLLSYSTVFHDCGNLFNKYVRHIDEDTYSQIVYEEDEVTFSELIEGLTGLRVNREPMSEMYKNDDEAEDCRLGSRFIIEDRYNSRRSSEGFHIYLWKESTDGVIPQDLYLKVEYNHAGYGRTLPFMMPYKDDKGGIKDFDEIVEDWTEEDNNGNVGYGIKRYLRYSYIHFKYCFDKKTNKGIYYLDPDQYGDSIRDYEKDNKIVINLYEAKISNK